MTRVGFIFISALLLLFAVFNGAGAVDVEIQVLCSLVAIALLGIPHGAIDHLIYLKGGKEQSPSKFYALYLGTMGLYALVWIFLPFYSLVAFMILSAYHFGESQFSEFNFISRPERAFLAISWGASILSGLVVYNHAEIVYLASMYPDISSLIGAFNLNIYSVILPTSTIAALGILIYESVRGRLKVETLLREVYILGLIHLCFFLLPVLVGFTLYFTVLHSFKVLTEEFRYLKAYHRKLSLADFIKTLAPYTIVSIAGAGFIVLLAKLAVINVSTVLVIFILTSILTLPHSFVMNAFYRRFFG